MKTENLIKGLAADAPMRQMQLARAYALAMIVGIAASTALFLHKFGVRANAFESLSTIRFPLKFVITLALTLPALFALYRLSRPDGRLGLLAKALLIAPVLLAISVVLELIKVPSELWSTQLIGHNSRVCLVVVPLLAIAPLAAAIAVLRHGAPAQPRLAAIIAGLAASGVGMTLYAANCPDDSPLFLATWYTIATATVTLASFVVAPYFTRW